MVKGPTEDLGTIQEIVSQSLQTAREHESRLQKQNTSLLVVAIVSSGVVTLVAGAPAVAGHPIVGAENAGWRLACAMAAIFGLSSAISTGLTQQLRISDRLSQANECLGRLKFLDISLKTGTRAPQDAAAEFADIAKTYPDFVE